MRPTEIALAACIATSFASDHRNHEPSIHLGRTVAHEITDAVFGRHLGKIDIDIFAL